MGKWYTNEECREALEAAVGGRSEAELLAEIKALWEQLKQARQDVWKFSRRRWVFSPSAGDRESRP